MINVSVMKWLCLRYMEEGHSAVMYIDKKKVSLDGALSSFEAAAAKIRSDLNVAMSAKK